MCVGTWIENVIKFFGLDKLAPKNCGCGKRKKYLNRLFKCHGIQKKHRTEKRTG
jgi:hypothetical protein